ncbi:MAG: hypothetical protein V7731_06640 [Amphritea sp.]
MDTLFFAIILESLQDANQAVGNHLIFPLPVDLYTSYASEADVFYFFRTVFA